MNENVNEDILDKTDHIYFLVGIEFVLLHFLNSPKNINLYHGL